MDLLIELLQLNEAKTPWDKLNDIAEKKHGEFGFGTLDEVDAKKYVDFAKANEFCRKHGLERFGKNEDDMKFIVNKYPEVVRMNLKDATAIS